MQLPRKEKNILKIAYKNLYIKSMEFNLTKNQRDEILDKVVEEQILKVLNKLIEENDGFSEKKNEEEAIEVIKNLMKQWKFKYDKKYSSAKWWMFWK